MGTASHETCSDLTAIRERLPQIEARWRAARAELFGLCDGTRKFTMCVPVQSTDSDEVLSSALNDIPWLMDQLASRLESAEGATNGVSA
jgi:hypothetical protein